MRYREIVENIQVEKSDYKYESQAIDQARGLDLLSSDVFSEYIRFLFELIQNADDSLATEVNIEIIKSYIIVSHNGDAFSESDVRSICSVGSGTKKSNKNATGYKGIGFKSVFGKSNYVVIFSKGFQFRFDETYQHPKFKIMPWQIIPLWTDIKDLPEELQDYFPNSWEVSIIIKLDVTEDVLNDLSELLKKSQVLLFLRNLKKIKAIGMLETVIEKDEIEPGVIELIRNSTKRSKWLVQRFEGKLDNTIQEKLRDHRNPENKKIPDKIRFEDNYEMSFAAKIENNKLVSLNEKETLLFTYLPTKVRNFEFPFLLNSNFLVDTSRENLHEDNVWNQWLMKTAGQKVIEWMASLYSTKYAFEILQLLPNIRISNGNKLNSSFFESFKNYCKINPFVPTVDPSEDNFLKTPDEIIIDRTGLLDQDFISTEAIIEFINRETRKTYSVSSFVHPKLESKHKLYCLGVYVFKLEDLEEFFIDEIFKKNHLPSQNFSLIKYFYEKACNDKILNDKLQNIPFIYSQNDGLKSPNLLCFPYINNKSFYNESFKEDLSKIHYNVFCEFEKNTNIIEWLKRLGVDDPSDIAYVEKKIIPEVLYCSQDTNDDKYQQSVIKYLFLLFSKRELSPFHFDNLKGLKIKTKSRGFIPAYSCYLSDSFNPKLKLENYCSKLPFVSEEYVFDGTLYSDWKEFFIKLGVKQEIEFLELRKKKTTVLNNYFCDWEYFSKYSFYVHVYYASASASNHDIKMYTISKYSFIEFCTYFRFSKLFWSVVFKSNPQFYDDRAHWGNENFDGYKYGSKMDENYIDWLIRNKEIIPTTEGKCMLAKDVWINYDTNIEIAKGILPVLNCDVVPEKDWLRYVPLKIDFNINDLFLILSQLSSNLCNEDLSDIGRDKRIGIIYNKISNLLDGLQVEEKNNIIEWAKSNKLLCDNGNFENANELKFVKIDGFINTSEHLKTLFIPENCETNTRDFEELLQLFGVQIIDSFIPDIKNKVPNATLKIQLQFILPFLTAIIERKHFLDYSVEFKRLSIIIDNTEFYNASEIVLSFKNQDEIILGPSFHAYLSDSELSFKGKWTSPITLYALIPELLKLFNISDLTEELKLLLQLNESEIEEWSLEQGYDVDAIKEMPEYEVSIEKVKLLKDEESNEQTSETIDVSVINEFSALSKILKAKNISVEQLIQLISNFDADEIEDNISISSKEHLDQKGKNEENRVARELVYQRLISEGFEFTEGMGENSVVNGVYKENIEYPLVVKSYRNTSYKFNIRPNEWIQLSKPNAMFWVHRGNGRLEVLNLEGLLRANSEFHVQFETAAFSFDGLVKFAEVFRFVKNVHFQLDAPNFSIAKAFEEYKFDKRENWIIEKGSDKQELLH